MTPALTSVARAHAAADLPLEQLAKSPGVSEADKVGEATRQFEAILVRQMLKSARLGSLNTEAPGSSVASSIYWDMVHENLADAITRGGGLGLGTALRSSFGVQDAPGPQSAGGQVAFEASAGTIKPHLRDAEVPAAVPPVALRPFTAAPEVEEDLTGSPDEPESTGTTHP